MMSVKFKVVLCAEKAGEWSLAPVMEVIEARRLDHLRQFMEQSKHQPSCGWIRTAHEMMQAVQDGWTKTHSDLASWKPSTSHHKQVPGDWTQFFPWWQETWKIWLSQGWQPKPQSLFVTSLMKLPAWNNRLLSISATTYGSLHISTNGTETKQWYSVYWALGYLAFEGFMRQDITLMSNDELKACIEDKIARCPMVIDKMAKRSCTAIICPISYIGNAAKSSFLLQLSGSVEPPPQSQSIWQKLNGSNVYNSSNKMLRDLVKKKTKMLQVPMSIDLDMNSVMKVWSIKAATMKWLASKRKDLLLRLQEKGLPLGYKRQHWGDKYQSYCTFCSQQEIETAAHLFWHYTFARTIWEMFKWPWRNKEEIFEWGHVLHSAPVTSIGTQKHANKVWISASLHHQSYLAGTKFANSTNPVLATAQPKEPTKRVSIYVHMWTVQIADLESEPLLRSRSQTCESFHVWHIQDITEYWQPSFFDRAHQKCTSGGDI